MHINSSILDKVERRSKYLELRLQELKKYFRWIINNDESIIETEIHIPNKPYKYRKLHEYCIHEKLLQYQGIEDNKYKYKIGIEKVENYLNKLTTQLKTYNKLIVYLRNNLRIESRTKMYRIYEYYRGVYNDQ